MSSAKMIIAAVAVIFIIACFESASAASLPGNCLAGCSNDGDQYKRFPNTCQSSAAMVNPFGAWGRCNTDNTDDGKIPCTGPVVMSWASYGVPDKQVQFKASKIWVSGGVGKDVVSRFVLDCKHPDGMDRPYTKHTITPPKEYKLAVIARNKNGDLVNACECPPTYERCSNFHGYCYQPIH
eukprot:Nk52_evm17s2377 gene=Nk52_evmTU17s2377